MIPSHPLTLLPKVDNVTYYVTMPNEVQPRSLSLHPFRSFSVWCFASKALRVASCYVRPLSTYFLHPLPMFLMNMSFASYWYGGISHMSLNIHARPVQANQEV